MKLNRQQFNLLTYLEKKGKKQCTRKMLTSSLALSLDTINRLVKENACLGYIDYDDNDNLYITKKGLAALEPYRVKKAIVLAAGFGSRLVPVTLKIAKPLVKVNGTRIIDTLIDALLAKEIKNIIIVIGYKKEQFNVLKKKYPTIKFVINKDFNVANNISSIRVVVNQLASCYICEADLYISNPNIISKYEFTTNYLGTKVNKTNDWCFDKINGYARHYRLGGKKCYQAYGISYWNQEDCVKLRRDTTKVYKSHGGKKLYWEDVPLKKCYKNYKVEIHECLKSDITEIDTFNELVAIDGFYAKYSKHK